MASSPRQPTADELRNGWTAESIAQYEKERAEAQTQAILHRKPPRPRVANGKYNVLRPWR